MAWAAESKMKIVGALAAQQEDQAMVDDALPLVVGVEMEAEVETSFYL